MFWIAMGPIAGLAGYGAWQVLSKKGGGSKILTALSAKPGASTKQKPKSGSHDATTEKTGHGAGADRQIAATKDTPVEEFHEDLHEDVEERVALEGGGHGASKSRLSSGGTGCAVLEFAGEGPSLTKAPKEKDWAPVRAAFHKAKSDLETWVDQSSAKLPTATRDALKERIRTVRIQRPPTPEEPDLAWRGIGVLSRDEKGGSLLRIGSGFLRLVQEQPVRARFELTRLVAQSALAPCELNRVGMDGESLWRPLAQCLNVKGGMNASACEGQAFSEAGWAISTALAHRLAPSGCEVPAMAVETGPGCLKQSVAWLNGTPLMGEGAAAPQREIASKPQFAAPQAQDHPAAAGGKH